MKDVMIDLEMVGTKPESAILSIGACYFDINSGEIGDTFYKVIDWEEVFDGDREFDADTLKWWMKQGDEARNAILIGKETLNQSLWELHAWFEKDCCPWGNGSIFDIAILENAYRQKSILIPWKFWNIRDVRTVTAMAKAIKYDYKKANERKGTFHNALDDAIHQAIYVSDIWQTVTINRGT